MNSNYKFTIQYDGTRYYGWQRQPDKNTIQGKIESVLSVMCGKDIEVIGAGRTDAGVHAKGMTANAVLDTDMSEREIRDYLNRYLPDDIAVSEVKTAGERFHARYNAVGKTYCYTCFDGEVKPVFQKRYVYMLDAKPDINLMKRAADVLVGEHDFRNFCVNPHMKKTTVRIVDRISISEKGGFINFTFHGTGFLQNMVRIMVGTLLEAGYGRKSIEDIRYSLNVAERVKAGPTAPPQGLCLISVDYN